MFGIDDLIGGGLSLAGNLIGGYIQNKKIGQAAEIQRKAAQGASDKVGVALGEANKPIAEATSNAQQYATAGANRAIDTAGAGADRALNTAAQSNALLDPYAQAGGTAADYLNKGVAEGGSFNRPVTMAELQMDPGFAFRLQQGQLALERSAAARGGSMSGGALKDLANYSQGLASDEYAKAFQRYQDDTAARYSRLFGTAGMGLQAGTTQGNNLNTAARYAGDIGMQGAGLNLDAQKYVGSTGLQGAGMLGQNTMDTAKTQADIAMGGANAQGAAKIAQGNAWGSAIGNTANTLGTAAIYGKYLKNPAVVTGPRPIIMN